MAVDPKIVSRIEKLLRLASPQSGAPEPERISACLEAARLFAENNLAITTKEEVAAKAKKRTSRTPTPARTRSPIPYEPPPVYGYGPRPGWQRAIAQRDATCADPDCAGYICRGDSVWARKNGDSVDYLHVDGPCMW